MKNKNNLPSFLKINVLLSLLLLLGQQSKANCPPAGPTKETCHTTEFVTWTKGQGNTGTGTFVNKTGVPDFTWTTSGEVNFTQVLNNQEVKDVSDIGFETKYGEADNASQLHLSSRANRLVEGKTMTKKSMLRLNFNKPTPSSGWAFSLVDLENEQVKITALDAKGKVVPAATIATWISGLFDANPSASRALPFWDRENGALIGYQSPQPTWNYKVPADTGFGGEQAAAAWLSPNISLSSLTLEWGVFTSNQPASIHLYLASCKSMIETANVIATTDQNSLKAVPVLSNGIAQLGLNPQSVTVVATPSSGTLEVNTDGSIDYMPNSNFVGTDLFEYRACDFSLPVPFCDTATVYIDVLAPTCTVVELKVFMEGPMTITNTMNYQNTMRADLASDRHILPGQTPTNIQVSPTRPGQPYRNAPWDYTGQEGTDWTDADYDMVAEQHGSKVVDWVLVTIIDANLPEQKLLRAAAVVLGNGKVVFERSCLPFGAGGQYLIMIEHRSHIGVMTPNPVGLTDGLLQFDFTKQDGYRDSPNNPTGFGQKEVLPGTYAMFACDGYQIVDFPSYDVTGADRIIWMEQNGQYDRYVPTDFNMDGDVNGFDKVLWSRNNGIFSRVPR